jgi:hypothetical protein
MRLGRQARLSKFRSFLITRDLSNNPSKMGWFFRWRKNRFRFIYQALLSLLLGPSIPSEISVATIPSNNKWKRFFLLWVGGATTLNSPVCLLHQSSLRQLSPNKRGNTLDKEQYHKISKIHLVLLEPPWMARLALSLSKIAIKGGLSLLRSRWPRRQLRYSGSSSNSSNSYNQESGRYLWISKRRRLIPLNSAGMLDTSLRRY